MNNKQEKIKAFLEELRDKLKSCSKARYSIFSGVLVLMLMFFLTSNMLFNNTSGDISTELKNVMAYDNISVSLEEREYNPTNGFIKFNVRVEDKNKSRALMPKFELRSKVDPSQLIPLQVQKVTDEEYIIHTVYNKKWSYLSLAINFTDGDNSEQVVVGPFKFYSNISDVNKNDNLVQKSMTEYYIEIIDEDIAEIKEKIIQIEQGIEKNLDTINRINENNKKLEDEKKYQIDEELAVTESQISSNNSSIVSLEDKNEDLKKQIKSLDEKISKLEIKKSDYLVGAKHEE